MTSGFLFPLKSHGKRIMRTKSPLHVFFIWCEKGPKSKFCEKKDNLSRLWELWEDIKSQASLHTIIIKRHFPKTGHEEWFHWDRRWPTFTGTKGYIQVSELEKDQIHVNLHLLVIYSMVKLHRGNGHCIFLQLLAATVHNTIKTKDFMTFATELLHGRFTDGACEDLSNSWLHCNVLLWSSRKKGFHRCRGDTI